MSDILKQEIILKKSRQKQIINAVVAGSIGLGCICNSLVFWKNDVGQWVVIMLGLFLLTGCIYYLNELRKRKFEIIISAEGIELRGDFFYSWPTIEKFSTDEDEGNVTLILKIKNQASVRFDITSLELNKKELTELVLSYGQPFGLTYTKH